MKYPFQPSGLEKSEKSDDNNSRDIMQLELRVTLMGEK